ncbi:MAG TPA: cob(I)yrinic acid a,c-diamide adenosyltransferase [Methylomirabilota bacterium]|nr:cob(I)yrinic acid a,c-diamide adenosyltransferase [Methylomirabilota bacterium]
MLATARIYTRTGDKGETGLFGGVRVPKDSTRVEAYGSVDETNSALGLVRSVLSDPEIDLVLQELQKDLFAAGADLANAQKGKEMSRITAERVSELERIIDRFESELPPLRAFILPGGCRTGASLHFARAVARRAERRIVTLSRKEEIDEQLIPFINRLSDLLFVLARVVNHREKRIEVEWHGRQS